MAFTKKSYDEFESKMRVVSRRGKSFYGVTMSVDSPLLRVRQCRDGVQVRIKRLVRKL